jgi:hypothetical protein
VVPKGCPADEFLTRVDGTQVFVVCVVMCAFVVCCVMCAMCGKAATNTF